MFLIRRATSREHDVECNTKRPGPLGSAPRRIGYTPVFVLTHHPRAPLVMAGGTTFHFVTEGIHAALSRAREAAKGKDVHLGGGVATIRQYLQAGLIDELHLAVSPVFLGAGENLFAGLDLPKLGYQRTGHLPSASATHVVFAKGVP